jgi:hypothetical protein
MIQFPVKECIELKEVTKLEFKYNGTDPYDEEIFNEVLLGVLDFDLKATKV